MSYLTFNVCNVFIYVYRISIRSLFSMNRTLMSCDLRKVSGLRLSMTETSEGAQRKFFLLQKGSMIDKVF